MEAKIIVKNGKKYKLQGKCNQCGKCCSSKLFNYVKNSEGELSYGYCIDDKNKPHCNAFDVVNKKCTIYDSKPYICNIFPSFIEELEEIPECGFKWIFIEETNEEDTIAMYRIEEQNKGDVSE